MISETLRRIASLLSTMGTKPKVDTADYMADDGRGRHLGLRVVFIVRLLCVGLHRALMRHNCAHFTGPLIRSLHLTDDEALERFRSVDVDGCGQMSFDEFRI